MKCPSCNGHGFVRGLRACSRCRGTGRLFPRFLGEDETPIEVTRDLVWCLIAILLGVASALGFMFL